MYEEVGVWMRIGMADAYIVDGIVKRGTINGQAVYPYRRNRRQRTWDSCEPKVNTMRSGLLRGNYTWQ